MSLPTQEFVWVYTGGLSCREAGWNAGELPGNVVINWHPIQGRVVTFLVASCYVETGISSGYMGHLISLNTNLTFLMIHVIIWQMSLKANPSVLIGSCLVHILPYNPIYKSFSATKKIPIGSQ